MSPILGKMRAFLARTRKDLSVALFCGRGYELRGFDNVGGRFCIVDFFFFSSSSSLSDDSQAEEALLSTRIAYQAGAHRSSSNMQTEL